VLYAQLFYATYFRNISNIKVNPSWNRMMIKIDFVLGNVSKLANVV
jgi:hypothetical protein